MSSNVVMIHGYGFCFQENAVGIIPSKLATVYKGNIIKINIGLPILRRDTAQTRLRAVFLYLGGERRNFPRGLD